VPAAAAAAVCCLQSYLIMAAVRDALLLSAAPPTDLLFSNRNIAALAAAVGGLSAQISVALSLTAGYNTADSIRPLSANQQQMWWLRELAGATVYNVPTAVSITGEVDPHLLQQALSFVAGRHEVLRMRYRDLGDGLVGLVDAAESALIPLVCRRIHDVSKAVEALQNAVSTPFDLAEAPPVCAYFLSSSPDTHVLGIVMHHIAGDGWSVGLLWKELSAAYTALAASTQPQLPPLPLQYPDYAVWQHKVLSSSRRAARWRSYWQDALRGVPDLLQLPSDRPRAAEPTYAGGTLFTELPAELDRLLRRTAAQLGVNMQAVLLGTLQVRPQLRLYDLMQGVLAGCK
jgi:hypothetical protein